MARGVSHMDVNGESPYPYRLCPLEVALHGSSPLVHLSPCMGMNGTCLLALFHWKDFELGKGGVPVNRALSVGDAKCTPSVATPVQSLRRFVELVELVYQIPGYAQRYLKC